MYDKWNKAVYNGIVDALARRDTEWANFLRGMFL